MFGLVFEKTTECLNKAFNLHNRCWKMQATCSLLTVFLLSILNSKCTWITHLERKKAKYYVIAIVNQLIELGIYVHLPYVLFQLHQVQSSRGHESHVMWLQPVGNVWWKCLRGKVIRGTTIEFPSSKRYYNNIHNEILWVGFGEDEVYANLVPTFFGPSYP